GSLRVKLRITDACATSSTDSDARPRNSSLRPRSAGSTMAATVPHDCFRGLAELRDTPYHGWHPHSTEPWERYVVRRRRQGGLSPSRRGGDRAPREEECL